jgi:hypothetical protein
MKSADFRRVAIVALVPLFVGIVSKNPPLILGMLMLVSGFFMSTIFGVAEKGNLYKLYGVLPVQKRQTVIGRYLFVAMAGIGIALLGVILAYIASIAQNVQLNGLEFIVWLCGSFLLFCLIVAAQFPFYFRYDFSKLAGLANLPYIILILAVTFLAKRYPTLFAHVFNFLFQHHYMIWVVGIAGSLLLLAVSCYFARIMYNSREL